MEHRINYSKIGLKAIKGLQELDNYMESLGLEKSLIELIRLRTSQINACNYCVSLHTEEAMQSGETRDRIDNLSSWRKKDIYSEREKAALAWTEALTLIAQNEISDEFYGEVHEYFDDQELITLTIAINGINSWNRLAISFRTSEKAKEQF